MCLNLALSKIRIVASCKFIMCLRQRFRDDIHQKEEYNESWHSSLNLGRRHIKYLPEATSLIFDMARFNHICVPHCVYHSQLTDDGQINSGRNVLFRVFYWTQHIQLWPPSSSKNYQLSGFSQENFLVSSQIIIFFFKYGILLFTRYRLWEKYKVLNSLKNVKFLGFLTNEKTESYLWHPQGRGVQVRLWVPVLRFWFPGPKIVVMIKM